MMMGKMKMHRKTLTNWTNEKPSQVARALRWIAGHDRMADYGYTGNWKDHLDYCSDRMNGGRARAILRLMKPKKKPINYAMSDALMGIFGFTRIDE